MKPVLVGTMMLALVATSACKRNSDDARPSQTTTTGANLPAGDHTDLADAGASLHLMNPHGAPAEPPPPAEQVTPASPQATAAPASPATSTTPGAATATPANGAAPVEAPRGTTLAPRSASEAAQRRDEGRVGPFGPSLIPAPVAPTSPASGVQGAGAGSGSGVGGGGGGDGG